MRPLPPVLLLGTRETALAVARSLAARGVEVAVSGPADGVALASRACRVRYPVARGQALHEHWEDLLLARDARPLGARVVLCTCDEALEFVAQRHAELSQRYALDMQDSAMQLALLDKQRTLELARAAGVATPAFWTVNRADDVAQATEEARFPLLVKPLRSHAFREVFGRKHFTARRADELRSLAARALDAGQALMLCELIPGPDSLLSSYYSYVTQEGKALYHFTKRVLRRYPLNEGGASFHITGWLPNTAQAGLRFFRGIGLRGLGNVEFKLDRRDGVLKLIECNARFTAAQSLVARAGIDSAWIAYRHALGEPVEAVDSWREGLCLWYARSDFRAFRQLRRDGRTTLVGWLAGLLRASLARHGVARPA